MREAFEEREKLSSGQTLVLLGHAIRYLGAFPSRLAVKIVFGLLSLIPVLLLPWPIKILVDHVIEGTPITEPIRAYPVFVEPFIDALGSASPMEILLWCVAFQAVLLVLVGAVGTSSRESDQAEGYLAGGHDTATRTENEANAGFSLAGGLLGYLDFRWTIRLTQSLNHFYRSRLFDRIQSLPISAFDDERIGDAVYRVMYDTPSITNGSFRIVLTPILAVVAILASALMIDLVFGDHPLLVQTGLLFLPLALIVTLPLASMMRRFSARSRKAGSTTTSSAEEGISNVLAVQSLGGEGRERRRFDRDSWESFTRYRVLVRMGMISFLLGLIPGLYLVSRGFFYAADLVIAGEASRGDFFLLFGYFTTIAFSAVEIGAMWFRVQGSAAGLHRVFHLMNLPAETDAEGTHELAGIRQGVELDSVSFSYDDGTFATRDVDLEAKVGEVTALVGPAGAGKTTLAYLLSGYLEPESGCVRVDGRDAKTVTRSSYRSHVAFVFQETALFDDTVEANIRMGNPSASEAEVRRAARMAGADDFIRALPEGYGTRLGRGGGKLSVGQKQRIAIARALVRDAPILVLDEPTSALDPETERRLVDSLREASRDRLVLVIAHRLSTIRSADQIVFLDRGAVVERGNHEELMARPNGAYREFVELQTRGAA